MNDQGGDAAPVRGDRILVVDDQPLLREAVATGLRGRGLHVATAGTPSEAVAAFTVVNPDALVMDIDLGPGPDGFELTEALRERKTALAVVFLTHLPDPRATGPGTSPGPGTAYLNKSSLVGIDDLVRVLDEVIDASRRTGLKERPPQ